MSGSPWFEDLNVGDEFNNVPEVTITEAHLAAHQMAFGDRLALPLSWPLSKSYKLAYAACKFLLSGKYSNQIKYNSLSGCSETFFTGD